MKHQRNEEFEKAHLPTVGGGTVGAVLARCRKCGGTERMALGSMGRIPPDILARKFEARGWDCSSGKRSRDLCEKCNPANKPKNEGDPDVSKPAPISNIVPIAPPAGATVEEAPAVRADPPPVMTRDDKRIIFAKLNDVYLNEDVGYSDGWTDQRVADDLSVPRAWVSEIREENFGPEAASEEIRTQIAEASQILDDSRDLLDAIEKSKKLILAEMERFNAALETSKGLKAAVDRVGKNVDRIQKAINAK